MNKSEHDLNRLIRSAAQAPREIPTEAPFGLEQRVLARWRHRAEAVEEWFSLLPLYRRALLVACVLALAALCFYLPDLTHKPTDDVVIINSPVTMGYLP